MSDLKVSEVFYSLQGEGILTGVPSAIIRFAGCNLRCAWCDTKDASWQPEHEVMSISSVIAKVASYRTRYVVITGGEPTIQPRLPELTHQLKSLGKHITLETNGTNFDDEVACDLVSMSPKLKHSVADADEHPEEAVIQLENRWNVDSFRSWIDKHDYQLKFVFTSAADIEEIQELIRRIGRDIPPDRIMLMPEGVDPESIRARRSAVVEACKQYGYRYCTRLQIDLFGNAKGT